MYAQGELSAQEVFMEHQLWFAFRFSMISLYFDTTSRKIVNELSTDGYTLCTARNAVITIKHANLTKTGLT